MGGSVLSNCLQCRRPMRCRFNPWLGKTPFKRKCQLIPVFSLGQWDTPMDRGAWRPTFHKVAKSWTRLNYITLTILTQKYTHTHTHTHTLLAWHEPNNQSEAFQVTLRSYQTRSVAQSCPTLCDPMNCSTPALPVHHQLPEFTQTHVHWVSDAIQPSHPLSSPSPLAPNPFQHESFPMSQLFAWGGQSTAVSALASFLPKKSQGWSPTEWTGWISLQSKWHYMDKFLLGLLFH